MLFNRDSGPQLLKGTFCCLLARLTNHRVAGWIVRSLRTHPPPPLTPPLPPSPCTLHASSRPPSVVYTLRLRLLLNDKTLFISTASLPSAPQGSLLDGNASWRAAELPAHGRPPAAAARPLKKGEKAFHAP